MDFLVLRQVTSDQSSTSLPLADWKPPNGMELANPEFFVSVPIDLVLGSQFLYDFHLLDGGRIQLRAGESEWSTTKATVSFSCHVAIAEPLDKIIEKFWTIEEMLEKPLRSQEKKDCEQHFQSTFTRDESGRYIVRYPKRNGFHDKIGDSKGAPLRRFRQLERRLERGSDLRDHYNEFLQEYLAMGHMQLIGEMEYTLDEGRTTYYLPHHPEFKESSSTTKIWVVFDGSAKTTTNHSLNDTLLTGPVIQDELLDIMVHIHPEDASLQWILWRFDQAEPIKVYELQTVTYGLAPSSFLATRVLKQLAIDAALEEQSTLHFDAETKVKTLEVVWETGTDQLCVEIRVTEYDDQWTKRKIFSEIAQLYDPLGIVSPVIAWAKIWMQHLWLVNVDWDDPIPREIESKWNDFHSQLPLLKQYKVPRYIFTPKATTVQFHVFCDASEVGYGACIYARSASKELLTHGHPWNHVKGTDNPADHVSRGMLPADFIVDILWRSGPGWLADEVDKLPKHAHPLLPNEDILERKKTVLVVQSTSQENPLFERYSSFGRLVQITAYLRQFIIRCRSKHHDYEAFLSTVELQEAKEALVKVVQQEVFPEELIQFKQKRPVPSKSPLKNRYPFLDENGIIRVGGRLNFSNETYQTKHHMALPNKHPLSPQPQGQLPKARIVPSRPFSITGVDYCGPIYLKPFHRRAASQKAFIAVFVCFATKATHLELVCDLSTDALIAALRRFIARCGLLTEIHSDNGTTFKGAKTTLTEMHRLFSIKHNKEKLINECSSKGITWRFIPPRAPNFGGLCEAAVKTAKSSLVKTIGCRKLSYEDMVTVLY
ncbi:uncharacterized protein LOC131687599 [Topomyia yanbarensis]|uniref:uncharacterized protein LOC131687599 n=1 Tax=Topomyia yanbarensis TaxID=2498891 RepID=UPI00273B4550|nr:uncharacterized protein LOC131687599 [Topomyia yanbarensis]